MWKGAEFGDWLVFAHFPILPTTNFNGINGYSFEMAPQFVCHLRITNPHSQLSQLLRKPSQKLPDVCVSPAFGIAAGRGMGRGTTEMEKASAEESLRQWAGGRAAQDTRKGEREELDIVREESAVLRFQTRERGWAGGSRTVWPAKAELQEWEELDTSSENACGFIPGFARFIQTAQDYLNSRSLSVASDAAHEVTLWGDILVAFDQTLKASGSPSYLQNSPQDPNTR